VVVLAETIDEHSLGLFVHFGVACETKDEVDQLSDVTRQDGFFRSGPFGAVGEPTGYFVNLNDSDGHTLELSFGQDIGLTVAKPRESLR